MPESEHRSRGVVGPVLLILIGVGLLLKQLGILVVDWSSMWRLWPILLILFGLDIILGRTRRGSLLMAALAVGALAAAAIFWQPITTSRQRMERETFAQPAQGIERAIVAVEVGVGQLELVELQEPANLYEVEVTYDGARAKPIHRLVIEEGEARVTLRSGQKDGGTVNTRLEEWRVALNPEIPMQLDLRGGVNTARLDLTGLTLTRLNVNLGVGDVRLKLAERGEYQVKVNGGVGELVVEIPDETEARIRADGGLGAITVAPRYERQGRYYVTKGYNDADNRVDLDIDGGVGSITIR